MKKLTIVLSGIILLAFILRIYAISRIPAGVDWDEASFGYNAYSLAKTGMDEWGKRLPLMFTAFGDFKLPVYVYLTAIVVKIAGLNIFSVRLVSVIAGSISVLLTYLIASILTRRKTVGLLAALFLAFSPYGIFYSRLGLDICLSNTLLLLALYFELLFLKKQRPAYAVLTAMVLSVLFFTYNIGRIIAPVLMIALFVVHVRLKMGGRKMVIPIIIMLVTLLIGVVQLKQGGASRFQFVGIFGDKKAITLDINELRDHDKNSVISKLLHNKATFFSFQLLENYVGHFSSAFLTHEGIPQTVQVSPYGPLYPIQLPFYFIGIIMLVQLFLKEKNESVKTLYGIILMWIVISPLPSIITEGEISRRYLGALGSWEILSAWGIVGIVEKVRSQTGRRILVSGIVVLYALSASSFLDFFFTKLPAYKNTYFYQPNLMGKLMKADYADYDRFIVSKKAVGEPQIFILFFSRFDPSVYRQTKQSVWDSNWISVKGFDKYVFPVEVTPEYLRPMPMSGKRFEVVVTADELTRLSEIVNTEKLNVTPLDKTNNDKFRLFLINNRI